MKRRIRIGSSVSAVAALGSVLTAATAVAPAAYAGGKSAEGCSTPYYLGSILPGLDNSNSTTLGNKDFSIYDYSLPLVDQYFGGDPNNLEALLVSLDHNGDDYLCYKLPDGWTGPPSTNASGKAGFLNLVDDYKTAPLPS